MATTQHIATCAAFLAEGVDDDIRKHDRDLNRFGGHIGFVLDVLAPAANALANWMDRDTHFDYPGVFHYELTPNLGRWLAQNPDSTMDEFVAKIDQAFAEWYGLDAVEFEVRPCIEVDGSVEECMPGDTPSYWGVYERRPHKEDNWESLGMWIADFQTEADARAFAAMKKGA